ncbi:hypothetical protein B296_00051937 [Ensete ventricosum]|uniref:Uncharacterized protein n=1 Tax=Ensete ventricosum TaxID=4639 RepID=A0A426XVF0_ENSVE|nr:hypothetical protein B296_00051937 [Ensete ventricosum]
MVSSVRSESPPGCVGIQSSALEVGCWSGGVRVKREYSNSGRSAVRPLTPPVYPVGYLRRVGHVGGPAVRGCDDLAARSAFVISFFPLGKTFSRRLMRVLKMRSCA